MNTIKKIALFFILFLMQDVLLAQTNDVNTTSEVANKVSVVEEQVKEKVLNSNVSSLDNPTQILTPEQQGFTKYNENGEIFYRKESGSLIIEYKPKN